MRLLQTQLWLQVSRVNVMALQCSVVEELIAFSALDNLKDLACVSVLALCLDQVPSFFAIPNYFRYGAWNASPTSAFTVSSNVVPRFLRRDVVGMSRC